MRQSGHELDSDGSKDQQIQTKADVSRQDADSLFELLTYYQEQGRLDDQIETARNLLTRKLSDSDKAEALHYLASALYQRGNVDQAIAEAEYLVVHFPDYLYLGSVHWLLGIMLDEHVTWQERLEDEQKALEASEAHLRQALELCQKQPDRAVILTDLGVVLRRNGGLEESKRVLEEALGISIENPMHLKRCYSELGVTLSELGEKEQARQYLENAIAFPPDPSTDVHVMTYVSLSALYRERGEIGCAERCCKQALQKVDQSDTSRAVYILRYIEEELGNVLYVKNQYEAAATNYQNALKKEKRVHKQVSLSRKLGMALQNAGRHGLALEAFRQALAAQRSAYLTEEQADVGDLLFRMGQCTHDLRDFQKAISLLEKAADLLKLPLRAEAQLWLGRSYLSIGRTDRAAEIYGQVLAETRFLSSDWRLAMKYWLWAKMHR